MRQKLFFVLVLALCLTMAFARAEETENTESAEEDMQQAEIMYLSHGSEIRLMQLGERIGRAIDMGDHILSLIEENDYNVSQEALSRMDAIVSELEDINEEVNEEIAKNNTETSVEFFIGKKSKVINLTQEFKKIVWDNLSVEHRKEIKDSFKEDANEEREQLKERIRERVKEFNRERTKEMLGELSDNVMGLLDKYANGELNYSDMRQAVKDEFTRLTPEKKREFLSNVKENRKELQAARIRAFAEKTKMEKEQVEKMKAFLEDKNLTYSEAKAKLGVFMKEKLQERLQDRQERQEELKDRLQDRRENGKGDDE